MIYMILLLILMVSFQNSMEIARDVLLAMRNFMTVLAPAYFLAMTMTSYVASAGVYYEFILLLVSGLQRVLELFVLPCIEIYVLLVMVDHLSGEERLSRLTELLEMVVGWSLKGVVAAVMAFHMIQGLLTPAADAFRKLTVSKGIEMIPGIGDAGSSVTDMVLGSAMLIKNGIGAAALVVLLLLCLIPLAKLGIMMAAYYLLAAVLQPISDERITGCLARSWLWHEAIISDHMYGAGAVPADCGIDHGYNREVIHKMGEVTFCKRISRDGRERQYADICGYGEDAGCILLTGTGDPESSSLRHL